MNHFLLISTAACLALNAQAVPQILPHAEGHQSASSRLSQIKTVGDKLQTPFSELNPQRKAKSEDVSGPIHQFSADPTLFLLDGFFPQNYASNLAAWAEVTDDAVYLDNIVPTFFGEFVPIKADRDGQTLSIPFQKIYTQFMFMDFLPVDCYVSAFEADEEGNAILLDAPYVMNLTEEGRIETVDKYDFDTEEGSFHMIGIFGDLSAIGLGDCELLGYSVDINLSPAPELLPQAILPEGAEPEEYIYYFNQLNLRYSDLNHVYIDGETVYLDGLTGGTGAWLKGTLADGKLTIPSGQFLGLENLDYVMYFGAIKDFDVEGGYLNGYTEIDALTLNVTANGFEAQEGEVVALFYADGQFAYFMQELDIQKFTGAVPAIPETPQFLSFYDMLEDYGQYFFQASLPTTGTNGEYLVGDNLEWCVWADDEIITFSGDDGYYLSEDIEWFPYEFMDEGNGYDISSSRGSLYCYVYANLFHEIGLQCRYTVDGCTLYSNIMYVETELNENGAYSTRIQEVENDIPTAIRTLGAQKAQSLFDIQGRRAEKAAKGLTIGNGEVRFVK